MRCLCLWPNADLTTKLPIDLRNFAAFVRLDHAHDIGHIPKLVSHASRQRGRNTRGLMDAREVVVHEIDGEPEFAGAKMMRRPGVAEAIAAEREASAQRTRITVDRVRQELARLAFSDIGDIADWDESGMTLRARDDIAPDDRAAIAELKLKQGRDGMRATIRLHSKQAALDALAKHMGLYGRGVKPALSADATPKRSGNDIVRERLLKIAGRKE